MASFDPEERYSSLHSDNDVTKYSIKRLEISIKKLVKVLEIDLDRLYKHSMNITKLKNGKDWKSLHKEQVNASRTVQQIKANIKEIEKARAMVSDEDIEEFDCRTKEVKGKALSSMQEFLPVMCLNIDISSSSENIDVDFASGHGDFKKSENTSRVPPLPSDKSYFGYDQLQATIPLETLNVVPLNSDASGSWEQLQENVVELNELVNEFAAEVELQGEKVDRIEENIESAGVHVKEGTAKLAQAAKYKSALLPVVGAVVGGVVAGPLGLMVGAKVGATASVIGGIGGFVSGRYIKKRQQTITDMELSNLSERRSISLPEFPSVSDDKQCVDQSVSQETVRTDSSGTQVSGVGNVFGGVASTFKKAFSFSGKDPNT